MRRLTARGRRTGGRDSHRRDGSRDATPEIADEYEARYLGRVRTVHKDDGGHGSTINVGLELAWGRYFRVAASDDWVDVAAFAELVSTLSQFGADDADVEVVPSNFVDENEGHRTRRAVRFRRALPHARAFGWDEVGRLRSTQYVLMHSIVYRTELLREVCRSSR